MKSFSDRDEIDEEVMMERIGRLSEINDKLTILPPIMPYAQKDTIDLPCPMHRNYDAKAYHFMVDNILTLADPILFWNIGG